MNNPLIYPFPSRRAVVFGSKGMTATTQPLAAQAGLDILKAGGNAVDAAVAMAMAMTVLEPVSNGIGGDAFCILWHGGKLYGLNASGAAPASISADKLKARGYDTMPDYGFIPVTVPGAPSAWAALSERFGRLGLNRLAEPAVNLAAEGFPVAPTTAESWTIANKVYKKRLPPELYARWAEAFTVDGCAPEPGEIWRQPNQAETLSLIAASGAKEFYQGVLAEKIDDYFRENGGYLSKADLESHAPGWVEPVGVNYRGVDVWEIPPNGQGIVALMALKILDGMELGNPVSPGDIHKKIEAVKLAFTEGSRHIADINYMEASVESLLSERLAAQRRGLITNTAIEPSTVPFHDHGTVYLCAADGEGNMVSYIQSNYKGFGSGVVVPGTGIALQDRGANFSLDGGHPNCLTPGKRPYHTIIPGFLTKGGEALGPFGIMGGFMQPQAHVQVLSNMLDYGLNPQAALDAPRWQWVSGRRVMLERSAPDYIAQALRGMGHEIEYAPSSGTFGRGQMILRNGYGSLTGATEPRSDGAVAAW
jgi:gamma-glutamyltranspeptidase/glutathione hydrolase